jgi:hypothetical protein
VCWSLILELIPTVHVVVRYHSDTQAMKIAQGVSGTVKSKGSVHNTLPFMCQAVRQGFQVCAGPVDRLSVQHIDGV